MARSRTLPKPITRAAGAAASSHPAQVALVLGCEQSCQGEELPEAKASALWNLAYYAGYGAGPAAFGLICVRADYLAAFSLTGALILAAVPVALREQKAVASA